jgi:hypothetical protein
VRSGVDALLREYVHVPQIERSGWPVAVAVLDELPQHGGEVAGPVFRR